MLLLHVQTLLDLSESSIVRSDALSFEGRIIPCENSVNINNNTLPPLLRPLLIKFYGHCVRQQNTYKLEDFLQLITYTIKIMF